MPGAPGATPALPEPKTLLEHAKRSFRNGRDHDGYTYLSAYYLCADEGPDDLKEHLKVVAGLKRPAFAVRFGIGVVLSAPKDFTGNPNAIGRLTSTPALGNNNPGGGQPNNNQQKTRRVFGQKAKANPGGGAGPSMSAGSMGMPGSSGGVNPNLPADPKQQLDYYTGDFGEQLLAKLEELQKEGKFGEVLNEMETASAPAASGGMPGMAGMPGMSSMASMAGMAGMPGMGGAAAAAKTTDPQGIFPGIVYLGAGAKDAIDKKARDQEVDVLVVYEVNIAVVPSSGQIRNSTKLVLKLVEKPEVIFASPALSSAKVEEEREKGTKEVDSVDAEIERAIAAIEKKVLFVSDFASTFDQEKAVKRLKTLEYATGDAVLRALVESRYYLARELITAAQWEELSTALIGDKAKKIINGGREEDRVEGLVKFMPKKKK